MVVLLVVLTITACLAVDFVRRRRAEVRRGLVVEIPDIASEVISERFLHPGHGWALLESGGRVRLGIDELAGRLLGMPDAIEVPAAGLLVKQGEPLVTLKRGGRALTIASPLSGTVAESNPDLADHPSLARTAPHEKGWIARIAPANLAVELRNLLSGAPAESWREGAEAQVRSWFAPGLGVVLQDGGEWVENLADLISEEDWERMAREFFHMPPLRAKTN